MKLRITEQIRRQAEHQIKGEGVRKLRKELIHENPVLNAYLEDEIHRIYKTVGNQAAVEAIGLVSHVYLMLQLAADQQGGGIMDTKVS